MKLIKISAMWCPACLIMRNVINNLDIDIEQVEYDYDLDEEEISKYNVGDILPVFILEDNGKEISRLIGENTKEEVLEFIRSNTR